MVSQSLGASTNPENLMPLHYVDHQEKKPISQLQQRRSSSFSCSSACPRYLFLSSSRPTASCCHGLVKGFCFWAAPGVSLTAVLVLS
ncbi:hypothetical protein L1887_06519 [Cichorium endivia]|nr:hypothetical protein L1887_06519 [Cichorium endivia]